MKHFTICSLFGLFVVGLFTTAVTAQQENPNKAQIMILGVYHFHNPNADVVKTNFPDHLSKKKQEEIADLLDLLARFKPTKIVVEATPEQHSVQEKYQAYLEDSHTLTANEIEQIGYRLAKRLGHKQIYLADHRIGMDFNAVFGAAKETNNKYILDAMQKVMSEIQEMQKRHGQMTVREALIELNEPHWQERTRDFYLQLARVRSKEKYVGADVLTSWYQRNFRILTNLLGVIESPEDRVLAIFGQGHAPYLREGVKSNSDLLLIEPNDFLRQE